MRMPRRSRWLVLLVLVLLAAVVPAAAGATPPSGDATAHRLVMGLEGGSGSTIGPDGALYGTESAAGFGGPVDIAFLGRTAHVLVTLVGPDVGGSDVVGIYRVDGPDRATVVADLGAFSIANPPATDFLCRPVSSTRWRPVGVGSWSPTGTTTGCCGVTRDGEVSQLIAFGNIVPTGLEVRGRTIYLAEAGPVPHLPEDGKVVAFRPKSTSVREVASGSPLLVDVEFGRGHRLYALSQGVGSAGPEGAPALPNTGALVRVTRDGTFTVVIDALNQPTSLEFTKNTAYVVTLGGEIWKIKGVSDPLHRPCEQRRCSWSG
jgi:hypothetical protein